MKAYEMHYSSDLFDKVLYMFRTGPLSASRRQQNQNDKYLLRVYSVEILLMMDSGHVRNMQSTLSNKFEEYCISLASIIKIYHDARSSECQIHIFLFINFCKYVVQSISSRTEFFALVRSVVTTPAARGIIPKVSWASVLKANFLCVSCVTQLQLLSRGATFSLRLSRWRIFVNNALASNSVSSWGKLLQNVMKC